MFIVNKQQQPIQESTIFWILQKLSDCIQYVNDDVNIFSMPTYISHPVSSYFPYHPLNQEWLIRWHRWSACDIGKVTWRKGWRMRCDVAEAMEGVLLILQPLHCIASPTSQALHLRHLASHPCSQLIVSNLLNWTTISWKPKQDLTPNTRVGVHVMLFFFFFFVGMQMQMENLKYTNEMTRNGQNVWTFNNMPTTICSSCLLIPKSRAIQITDRGPYLACQLFFCDPPQPNDFIVIFRLASIQ